VYSLGNFVFNTQGQYAERGKDPYSLVARFDVTDDGDAASIQLRLYPIFSDNMATNFQPRPVTDSEFEFVQDFLLRHSRIPRHLREDVTRGKDDIGHFFEVDVTPTRRAE
jgi:hypothetical protein